MRLLDSYLLDLPARGDLLLSGVAVDALVPDLWLGDFSVLRLMFSESTVCRYLSSGASMVDLVAAAASILRSLQSDTTVVLQEDGASSVVRAPQEDTNVLRSYEEEFER